MTMELTQLFELWEKVKSLDEEGMKRNNLIEEWEKLCWSIQIKLILAGDEKIAFLNALASLSDRIYERYRKQRRISYLQKLLEKLATLLADRETPEKYRRSLLKITLVSCANGIVTELVKMNLKDELFTSVRSALKDISINAIPSKHILDYLRSIQAWLKLHKVITPEQLIEYLISIDFNHPAFLEFLFNLYELPNLEEVNLEGLQKLDSAIKAKQLHLEMLKLRMTATLFTGIESVPYKLYTLISTQLKWISLRLKNQYSINGSAVQPNITGSVSAKQLLSKWPADKSDLVELAYGLYVYMRTRGSHVTIVALVKWFEDAFGVNLARYSHRFAEIKMRKSTRPSKFLDAMVNEFLNYVEEGNAFEPDINREK